MRNRTPGEDESELPSLASSAGRVERGRMVPIADFYEEDERRRTSTEKRLGLDWWDGDGSRFELSWIHDTGELYLLSESTSRVIKIPATYIPATTPAPLAMVIATIADEGEVDRILDGWREAMNAQAGIGWVLDRVDGVVAETPADQGGQTELPVAQKAKKPNKYMFWTDFPMLQVGSMIAMLFVPGIILLFFAGLMINHAPTRSSTYTTWPRWLIDLVVTAGFLLLAVAFALSIRGLLVRWRSRSGGANRVAEGDR